MGKGDLFQRALPYYVLAIAAFVEQYESTIESKHASYYELQQYWSDTNPDGEPQFQLDDNELFEAAMNICDQAGMVEPLLDDFGPPIYVKPEDASRVFAKLESEETYRPLFKKFRHAGVEWLRSALSSINMERWEESKKERKEQSDWAPIPIERELQVVEQVTTKLDEAIEAIRSDNGYTANHLEEREFVLDGLRTVAKRLGENTQISVMYLREYALVPLGLVINRFGRAVTGIAAEAARMAIVDWLKTYGIDILRSLGRG